MLGNEINAVEIIWFQAWYFIKAHRGTCSDAKHPHPRIPLLFHPISCSNCPSLTRIWLLKTQLPEKMFILDISRTIYASCRIENPLNWSSYSVSRPLNLCEKTSWVSGLNKGCSEYFVVFFPPAQWLSSLFLTYFLLKVHIKFCLCGIFLLMLSVLSFCSASFSPFLLQVSLSHRVQHMQQEGPCCQSGERCGNVFVQHAWSQGALWGTKMRQWLRGGGRRVWLWGARGKVNTKGIQPHLYQWSGSISTTVVPAEQGISVKLTVKVHRKQMF